MKWFYNLKIGKKLIISFLVLSAVTAMVGYLGLANMSKINDMLANLFEKDTMGISYLKEANINMLFCVREQKNILFSSTAVERVKYIKRLDECEKTMKESMEKAKPLLHSEQTKVLFAKYEKAWEEYWEINKKVVDLAGKEGLANEKESAALSKTLGREKIDVATNLLAELVKTKEEHGRQHFENSAALYAQSRNLMLIVILACVLLGVGLGVFISRIISKPIVECVKVSNLLAEGHLDIQIEATSK